VYSMLLRTFRGLLTLCLALALVVHASEAAKVNELLEGMEPAESDVFDIEYSRAIDPSLSEGFVGAQHRREVRVLCPLQHEWLRSVCCASALLLKGQSPDSKCIHHSRVTMPVGRQSRRFILTGSGACLLGRSLR
jgi:hypothetical protein